MGWPVSVLETDATTTWRLVESEVMRLPGFDLRQRLARRRRYKNPSRRRRTTTRRRRR